MRKNRALKSNIIALTFFIIIPEIAARDLSALGGDDTGDQTFEEIKAVPPPSDKNKEKAVAGQKNGTSAGDKPAGEKASPENAKAPTKEEIELKRQQREVEFQRNLETTIQKVGAKTDRPQDKDSKGNAFAPEDLRHKDELKPEWEQDISSEKVTKAQQQALQSVGGTIEMPGAKKADDKKAAEAEKKLEKVVKQIEAGALSPAELKTMELLIGNYRQNPSETNANQIISQVVTIGEKVAAASPTSPSAIERSPEILRPSEANQDSQLVIETKSAGNSLEGAWGQETTRKMREISSLLKSDKKTITPGTLAAKELSNAQLNPSAKIKTNNANFDAGQPKPSPVAFIQATAKTWVTRLLQALSNKPHERGIASLPERETSSTPELKVDAQIHSVEGSVGPLTTAILNPDPEPNAPQVPTSLLFGLGLVLTGALLVISKVRR